uniref:ERCC4 domain-containing protein n=1 Tax=Picocystis salinarum TaxID=88271 RepID=A0A7S3UA94_9CHLO|mmetsp:Transcript_8833/g.54371  ORF Transcript_8833/g.54371 Transcript_8833/m.54371 type:complete len:937 (+) Transcript_8833:2124-4934(+)|eukprot:CAMPEP_0183828680 /NCGR_PEP_ID=MMETSP0807_2-20130328/2917_1 /TAXON_ID=88271 /ORGANISM="Picocystis salinarum, Strain CCMP1897" /LENGTH=936 /DNA_ID=CAMNT_0026073881 /DNA_START=2046 /DNA_END=4856 /DNA_ORIENTATION=-
MDDLPRAHRRSDVELEPCANVPSTSPDDEGIADVPLLLPFHRHIANEMLQEDGLCVLGTGMGQARVAAALLAAQEKRDAKMGAQNNMLIVLGASETQREGVDTVLQQLSAKQEPSRFVSTEYTSEARNAFYAEGGILHFTTRILVVDILTKKLPIATVSGVVVLNAERVSENSGEGFSVRLLLEGAAELDRKSISIWGLSDSPHRLVGTFGAVEKVMKALYARRLYLWPRFKAEVHESLPKEVLEPCVVEVSQPLTPRMQAIQDGLWDVMKACLKELRRVAKGTLDTSDIDTDDTCGLFRDVEEQLWRQIRGARHTVGTKTRQIVRDIGTLRRLVGHLLRLEPVVFLKLLETLRAAEGISTVWLYTDAAHHVFEFSRRRVYQMKRQHTLSAGQACEKDKQGELRPLPAKMHPIFEPLPKWNLVKEIIEEARSELRRGPLAQASRKSRETDRTLKKERPRVHHPILIAVQDSATACQLYAVLKFGADKVLEKSYQSYQKEKNSSVRSQGGKNGGQRQQKRKAEALPIVSATPISATAVNSIVIEAAAAQEAAQALEYQEMNDHSDEVGSFDDVYFHVLGDRSEVLLDISPIFIVMHDPDLAFLRQVEIYKCEQRGRPLRLYFVQYESSIEEFKYRASVERETSAFERLIRGKATMLVPVSGDRSQVVPRSAATEDQFAADNLVASHRSGGWLSISTKKARPRIVVDIREFMSTLPAVLHQQNFEIQPITLEVGDYVLSSDICIERKSISDLYGSFNSGRLFTQMEAMTKNYKIPVLLIEFDANETFGLTSSADLGDTINAQHITSKIALLILHFPRTRIIWSRSLNATADIFQALKSNQDDPDPTVAAQVGVPEEDQHQKDISEDLYNQAAIDVLRKLPGVTNNNYRQVMSTFKSLAEMSAASKEDLAKVLGGMQNAKRLHDFLHAECPRSEYIRTS